MRLAFSVHSPAIIMDRAFLMLAPGLVGSSFPAGPFSCDSGEQDSNLNYKGLREIHPAGGGWIKNAAVV